MDEALRILGFLEGVALVEGRTLVWLTFLAVFVELADRRIRGVDNSLMDVFDRIEDCLLTDETGARARTDMDRTLVSEVCSLGVAAAAAACLYRLCTTTVFFFDTERPLPLRFFVVDGVAEDTTATESFLGFVVFIRDDTDLYRD